MRKLLPVWGLIAVLTGCGSPSGPPSDDAALENRDTVVIGVLGDVQSWNPYLAEDLDTEQILALVYPSLAVEQPDYRDHPPSFAPSLARSWAWSDDHLELTLELDPTARWSDGVAITADDVVFSWQAQTAPEVGWLHGYSKDFITVVEAVDPHTVRVVYTHHYPYQLMDLNDGLIIPAHRWSEIPFDAWAETDWSDRVVAGGPFALARHTPQQQITLDRNPGRAGSPLPRLDRVVFRIVPSEQGLVTQLLAGEIDFIRSVPPSSLGRIRDHGGFELVVFDDRSYTHICWNTTAPPLDDAAVRNALTLAIDRQAIIDAVYGGHGRPAVGPVLSTFWAFNRELEPAPFDPEAARAALTDAGWSDSDGDGVLDRGGVDFAIGLLSPAENQLRQDIALVVQRDLERVGVRVEPRTVEWGTLMALLQRGEFDGVVNQWEEPTQIDLEGLWHTPAHAEPTFNFGRYGNPEVDRLLADVAELTDPVEQKDPLDRIQTLIVADQPYTFLVENTRVTVHSAGLSGVEINATTPYFSIEEWTFDQGSTP